MDDPEVPAEGEETIAMSGGSSRGAEESSSETLPTTDELARRRYLLGEVLGEGGMGIVYEAQDRQLKRTVAVKLLRNDDRASVDRFLREARAQARVEHPNICKVYEVGRLSGRPYIAMQRIRGVPSSDAAPEMTVEQKARLIRDVADAIQAAHAVGLVHRDLKPSNILIERGEDGALTPYVTDFGIARDPQAPGLTAHGEALGSPAYMAPEQALGDPDRMDRRTDVYGLGATLFELLTGRPPFEGKSALEVMQKVVDQDAPSVTAVRPGLPSDLATIVHKCLEKEPGRRYGSAAALARDLERFLAGDPVEAQRTSLLSRVRRRVRKHRVASGLLAAALVVIAVLAARLVVNARAAAEREEYARRFGQEAERVEGLLRVAALMPLHDTQAERGAARRAVDEIRARIPSLPEGGRAAAHFAAGRGLLALQEPEHALPHLSAAWDEGARRPEVALALGRALGDVFQKELFASRKIGDPKEREARVAEIRRLYRDRAVEMLGRARELPMAAPQYVLGMIAFHEEKLPQAAALAREAFEKVPSMYEAKRLEGDVLARAGFDEHVRGRLAQALDHYTAAREAYRKAAEIARSDPRNLDALCRVEMRLFEVAVSGGRDVAPRYDAVISACRTAAAADSGFASPWSTMSLVAWKRGQHLRNERQDPLPTFAASVAYADESIRRDPNEPRADTWAGVALTYRAEVESERGLDPAPTREAALARYRRAIAIDPAWSVTRNALATILLDRGKDEARRGLDPTATAQEAEESALAAARLDPTYAHALAVAGECRLLRALHGPGADSEPLLDSAEQAFRTAIGMNPAEGVFYLNLADVLLARAGRGLAAGADARPWLREARLMIENAVKSNPTDVRIADTRARLELLERRAAKAAPAKR